MINQGFIIGVDEVGRGPLAGRIFVGAVLLPVSKNNFLKKCMQPRVPSKSRHILRPRRNIIGPIDSRFDIPCALKDSKKLSKKQREKWFEWIKKNKIPFAVSAVSPEIIDRINIARACDKAASRAVAKIIKKFVLRKTHVVADAGILVRPMKEILSYKSFPKADEIIPAVSLASIVAKVKRDAEMKRMAKLYPYYGFDSHKGYGTDKHIQAIKKFGPSPIHRLTFIRKFTKIRR